MNVIQDESSNSIGVNIRNIGGISECTVELSPGVNVLAGSNATNRTSFLKALAAAQGSEAITIKGEADTGEVELHVDGNTYSRSVRVDNGSTVFDGETLVAPEDHDVAERFAFLFEQNPAREAIRRGDDLRALVMEPVDTAEIDSRISKLKTERSNKEQELEKLESLQADLPSLKQRRNELTEKIESLEMEISETETEIENAESSIDDSKETKQQIEQQVTTVRETESELDSVESKIQTTEQTISHLEADLEEAEAEHEALESVDSAKLSELSSELSRLRDEVTRKERMMSELGNIIQFNENFLSDGDGDQPSLNALYPTQNAGTEASDALVSDDDSITCWTCGTETSRDTIVNTVERLQSVHEELHGEREQLRTRIEELKDRQAELESIKERRRSLEESIASLSTRITENTETLADLTEEKETLEAELADAEAKLERLRQEREDAILDLHQELNTLEHERKEATVEHDSVVEEIGDIETEIERIDPLKEDIEFLSSRIEDLRERVERIEADVVESFNEHMDAVLDALSYENIERVWIDRRKVERGTGRGTNVESRFDLHVVRETDDGTTYEDSVSNLSESEREVTGLIFALAGYLAHDVHEKVPFMLLDSLEAIDSQRIASLIEYIHQYADNIVVALLEEDAEVLPDEVTEVPQEQLIDG